MKKTLNKIGLIYTIFGIAFIALQTLPVMALNYFAPDFLSQNEAYISLALVVLSVDIVGFSIVWLLSKKMPKGEVRHEKIHFGHFLIFAIIMYGVTGIGIILGLLFHLPLTIPFSDYQGSDLSNVLMDTNAFIRVLVVGILAPVFEELLFRKILIDRVVVYGELIAILLSGVMFGLFHGNFQQCFFACFIGMLFAYVYIKTGKIIYTILLHMTMNCATSIITLGLYSLLQKSTGIDLLESDIDTVTLANSMNEEQLVIFSIVVIAIFAWFILLLLLSLTGIILLIVFLATGKVKIKRKEGDPSIKQQIAGLFTSPLLWLFYGICAILFIMQYLPPILMSIVYN